MNEREDFPPMKPVHEDDVRATKPWWVLGTSRGNALFLAIFYMVGTGGFLVIGFVKGNLGSLLGAVAWLVLALASWVSVAQHRGNRRRRGPDGRPDGGETEVGR